MSVWWKLSLGNHMSIMIPSFQKASSINSLIPLPSPQINFVWGEVRKEMFPRCLKIEFYSQVSQQFCQWNFKRCEVMIQKQHKLKQNLIVLNFSFQDGKSCWYGKSWKSPWVFDVTSWEVWGHSRFLVGQKICCQFGLTRILERSNTSVW